MTDPIELADLDEGDYDYVAASGLAYIYRVGVTDPADYVHIIDAPLLADGQRGRATHSQGRLDFVPYDESGPADQYGPYDEYALWRSEDKARLSAVRTAIRNSAFVMKGLCEAQEGYMPFTATTSFVIFGDPPEDVAAYLYHVALRGRIWFTRHLTKPNVFTIEIVDSRNPPDGFPTEHTGLGGAAAVAWVKEALRLRAMNRATYPYRDRQYFQIEVS